MLLPFGILMLIGLSATYKFLTGAPSTRKWPVAPESEMAYSTADVYLYSLRPSCKFMKTILSQESPLKMNAEH